MIELRDLSAGYGMRTVVSGVSLVVPNGGIFTLIGPNGSGKSTIIKTMAGLIKPASGRVLLDGCDIEGINRRELAKKIAYLAQARQAPGMSVGEMALHGRFPYAGRPCRYTRRDRELADEALNTLGIYGLKDRLLDDISGGERQKAYIAQALVQDAGVIMLDEPTTYLDIQYRLELMRILDELRAKGRTVIAVMHDIDLALENSDMVAVVYGGKLACCASPEDSALRDAVERAFNVKLQALTLDDGTERFAFSAIKD